MQRQNYVTILHLSDLQFGKNHRFFNSSVAEENFSFDTLLARLQADLQILKKDYSLQPNIVIVTGDIVEWGQKSEFDQALSFLNNLSSFLNVPKSYFVLTPGNHDINRKSCEAYFAECAADEQEPSLPYLPKWKHFQNFCKRFYSDNCPEAELESLYRLIEYPDLKITVANLNSTIKESHRNEDHYGWIGETQAQEIAEKLANKKKDGWFNIAAVHHNVIRGETKDDDNLQDAEMLQRVIGEHIDMLLHGHTHRGKIHWWEPHLPIIGTGSAAVNKEARQDEVPNQYQVLKINGSELSRYCRAFAPDEAKWIPDSRVGDNGIWKRSVNFRKVHVAFSQNMQNQIEKIDTPLNTATVTSDDNTDKIPITFKPVFSTSSFTHSCDSPPDIEVWVGREQQLKSILTTGSGVISITGIGGQGKSTLAAKCLEQWKINFPKAFWDWRDCREQGDRFHTQLINQIERITDGRVRGEALYGALTYDLVKYLFEQIGDQKCLFVFDNVDQYVNVNEKSFSVGVASFVNEALRCRHNCLILITCRPTICYPNIRFHEIDLIKERLSFEDTIKLFDKRGVNTKTTGMLNTLNKVYRLTDGHTLWLDLLAIQISRNEKSSENILEELEKGETGDKARSMLRPIWKGLNTRQQQVLRCIAEIPRPMDIEQIHNCIHEKIKSFNQCNRAFETIKALHLVVKRKTDDDCRKYDLHPLVRSFIKTEYATTKERLPYIMPIVCFWGQHIMGLVPKITQETSFDKLRMWSEKAELEIEAAQMSDAIESLSHVADRLIATGYSEELFRVGKRIIDDFCTEPIKYNEFKDFDSLFHLIIEALIEFGHETQARNYLKYYEEFVEAGTARFIGLCQLMAWVEWHLENYEDAIIWGKKGKNLKEKSSIDTDYDCSHDLALALRDSGRYDEALNYFLLGNSFESLFSSEDEHSDRDGSFWGNIARCLMFKSQHDKAIYCLRKSARILEKAQSAGEIKNQGYAAKWIAECLEKCSLYDDAYIFYRKAKIIWDQRAPILSSQIDTFLKSLEQSQKLQTALKVKEKDIIRRCSVWINSEQTICCNENSKSPAA
jgi:3',5'-cyclic AMP phosphodiesterase CpdA